MITKKQFLNNFTKEIDIIRHLGTKLTPEMMDYRPSEKQRTMLELMNYLGHIFSTGTTVCIIGDTKNYMDIVALAPKVSLVNFDLAMKEQMDSVVEKIEALTTEDLEKEIEIFGHKDTLAMHLLGVMKWAVAYKMQFFLYIKACGNHDISTSNLWRGTDPAPKQ
jgi:hypothetical protein